MSKVFCPKPVLTHQEASFNSFEGLLVSIVPHKLVLANERERVADSQCLLEPIGPAHGHRLQPREAALLYWHQAMQLSLQSQVSRQSHTTTEAVEGLEVASMTSMETVGVCLDVPRGRPCSPAGKHLVMAMIQGQGHIT